MQEAFRTHHGLQCGFCTPGMIMMAVDIVKRHPDGLDEETIRKELEGNICRCTGYHNIVKAIDAAAEGHGPPRPRWRRNKGGDRWEPKESGRASCARKTSVSSPAQAATRTISLSGT